MVILITGASHAGKTVLAQKLLEKHGYPYLSIDHLKMGLIRSRLTDLNPSDDEELTSFTWPIVREMIKTAIENHQNLIVEGCYVPADWKKDLDEKYLSEIEFVCLALSRKYILNHADEILKHESDIERRMISADFRTEQLIEDNQAFIERFQKNGDRIVQVNEDYEQTLKDILNDL